jgi:hypothetical protein
MFNATFNNISVILVEETGVPAENHRPAANHRKTLSHNVVSSTSRLSGIRTHVSVYIVRLLHLFIVSFSSSTL